MDWVGWNQAGLGSGVGQVKHEDLSWPLGNLGLPRGGGVPQDHNGMQIYGFARQIGNATSQCSGRALAPQGWFEPCDIFWLF